MNLTGNASQEDQDVDGLFMTIVHGPIPLWIQAVYFTYVAFIFVTGIPGNLIIVVVYAKTKTKIPCDWFILFIGVTHFLVCMITPLLCIHTELDVKIPYINGVLCGLEQLWELTGMTSSCFILTIMSIERYMRVCRQTAKYTLTPLKARNLSIAFLVVGFCISLYQVFPAFKRNSCYNIVNLEYTPENEILISFAIFLVFLGTVIFTYGRVIHTLEKHIKVKQRLIKGYGGQKTIGTTDNNSKFETQMEESDIKTVDDCNTEVIISQENQENNIENIEINKEIASPSNHTDSTGNINGGVTYTNQPNLFDIKTTEESRNKSEQQQRDNPFTLFCVETQKIKESTCVTNTNTNNNTRNVGHHSSFHKARRAIRSFHNRIRASRGKSQNSIRKTLIRERQVTLMLLCVTVVFMFTWLPSWILYLLAAEEVLISQSHIATRIAYRYCDKIFLLNYISSFIIYYRFNATFRTKAKAVIPKWVRTFWLCCCLRNLDDESHA